MDTLPSSPKERLFPLLTELQEGFAVNYAANGGNGAKAAIAAGYSKNGAAVTASRLLNDPRVCAAVMQCCVMQQAASVPEAQGTVRKLMRKSKSEYVRLEAAKDVLTRAGVAAPQRVQVAGGVSITIDLGD